MKVKKKYLVISFVVVFGMLVVALLILRKPSDDLFAAPGRDYPSEKKVEDYFVEKLRMTQSDLEHNSDRTEISFYVTDNSTIEGIVNNLEYYGFVRDGKTFRYALENTQDNTEGKDGAIKVGSGDIDIRAYYRISENMTAWEIADILLNQSNFWGSHGDYGNLFMP